MLPAFSETHFSVVKSTAKDMTRYNKLEHACLRVSCFLTQNLGKSLRQFQQSVGKAMKARAKIADPEMLQILLCEMSMGIVAQVNVKWKLKV